MKQASETPPSVEEEVEHNETLVREKPPLTRERLHELHWVKGLSTYEIAEKTGRKQREIYSLMKEEGTPIRNRKEAQRLRFQREVERARRCVRPDVRELLKKLERDPNVERTKDGHIKLRSLSPKVRRIVKKEALRLHETKGWGYRRVATLLGIQD